MDSNATGEKKDDDQRKYKALTSTKKSDRNKGGEERGTAENEKRKEKEKESATEERERKIRMK